MGRLSLTTTYDHVPSIWLQRTTLHNRISPISNCHRAFFNSTLMFATDYFAFSSDFVRRFNRVFRCLRHGIHNTHSQMIAGVLIFTCIPWASIAMLSADNTFRFPGLFSSVLLGVRTISGHVGS